MPDTKLRDNLALERTQLANERTLLAYSRTALSLLAAGAALLHFFADRAPIVMTAWSLLALGGLTLAAGLYRFTQVRAHLKRLH